jgi:branched-chain amino acid aminotransferase
MNFDVDSWKVAPAVKKRLDDIRTCQVEDKYGWMHKI